MFIKSQKIFLLVLLIFRIRGECGEYCLKCSQTDLCLVCDNTNQYKLVQDKCEKVDIENCAMFSVLGDCLLCNQNYYPNLQTKKCVAVEEKNKIENCLFYDSTLTCLFCQANYYINGGKCTEVINKVSNCEFHILDNNCAFCQEGYLNSFDGQSCTSIQSQSNCQYYSRVTCKDCSTDYIKNQNLYFKSLFKFTSSTQVQQVLNYMDNNDNTDIFKQEICEKTVIKNCIEFTDVDNCSKCVEGYYLTDDNKCEKFPISVIENCIDYTSFVTCVECTNQFLLKNQTTCTPVDKTSFPNCQDYNGTIGTTQCLKCQSGFYLSGTTCKQRTVTIDNCDLLDDKSQTCIKCSTGNTTTSDLLKCLNEVSNCKSYNSSTQNDVKLICSVCIDGYILDGEECKSGSIGNCLNYTASTTFQTQVCQKCENQFYLTNQNTCQQIATINQCENYHKSRDNSCLTCQKEHYNFLIIKKCKTLTPIDNCIEYKTFVDELKCETCANGYLLSDDFKKCDSINIDNCAQASNQTACEKCKANFSLNANSTKCQPAFDTMTLNCLENSNKDVNNETFSAVKCSKCKINSVPMDLQDIGVCIKNTIFPDIIKTGCLRYSNSGTCTLCENNRYLSAGECVETCPAGKLTISRYDFTLKTRNMCITTVAGCDMVGLNVIVDEEVCIKCKTDFISTITFADNNYSNLNPAAGTDLIENIQQKYSKLTCVDKAGKTINGVSVSPILIANCTYYILVTGTQYGCLRCKDFFTGKIHSTNNYIESCSRDIEFQEVKKYGIDLIWEKLFSGYVCQSPTKIPFVGHKKGATPLPTFLHNVDLRKAGYVTTDSDFMKSNFCSLKSADPVENNNLTILANCGLGTIQIKAADDTFDSFVCAACEPGYSPTNDATYAYVKTACTKIDDCIGKDWFNGCSQCSSNFIYQIVSDNIVYTNCVTNPTGDSNCYAFEGDECKFCKVGYVMNEDKICTSILAPKCTNSTNFRLKSVALVQSPTKQNYGDYQMYYYKDVLGCSVCKSGYISREFFTSAMYICAESDYIKTKSSTLPTTSKFIKNCDSYSILITPGDGGGIVETFKCHQCKVGFILENGLGKCVTELTDCVLASQTENQCVECKAGFALKNHVCVKGNIGKCLLYYNDDNKTDILCKTCEDGYFKDIEQKKCLETYVKHCKTPTSLVACDACESGYFLYDQNSLDYCYPIDANLQCSAATIETNEEYGGQITCTTCNQLHDIFVVDEETNIPIKTICMPHNVDDNCETYNTQNTFETSTFHCSKCKSGFYLKDDKKVCIERINKPNGCDVYEILEDKCKTCNSSTFLNNDGKECTIFPIGILGCVYYTSKNDCTRCDKNMYLSGKSCVLIEEDKRIDNCLEYQNENTCKSCDLNYFLESNQCVKANVENCVVLKSVDSCVTCKDGFGLQESAGKLDCKSVSVANCNKFDPVDPFPCLECIKDYYPDTESKCQLANPLIGNCQIYQSNDKCKVCIKNTVLSLDQTKCLDNSPKSFIPENCEVAEISDMFCATCQGGNYFKNNECTACGTNGPGSGCFSCDPLDQEKCFICSVGYYMNKEGACIARVVPVVQPAKSYIMNMFLLVLVALIFKQPLLNYYQIYQLIFNQYYETKNL